MTNLKEFLDVTDIPYRKFAELVGTSISTLHAIVVGKRLPTLDLALRIEKQTGGKVTPYDYQSKTKS